MTERQDRILIVDDDKDILELLKYNLEREGYKVAAELNSIHALETAKAFNPDLIILDIMMPKINGIEVCSSLRACDEFKSTYIFFLTAKSERYLQIEALSSGGDDFIEKITGLRALTHKVSTVLKNNLVIRKCVRQINLGDLNIDRADNTVYYKNKKVVLPKHEFELLYFLAQNPKKKISQESILNNIWGSEIYLLAKSVDAYVSSIETKLGDQIISRFKNKSYCLK